MKPIEVLRSLPLRFCGLDPETSTSPELNSEIPARDLRSELFPAPFRPIIATISLLEIVVLTDFRAWLPSYVTERSRTLMMGSPAAALTTSLGA